MKNRLNTILTFSVMPDRTILPEWEDTQEMASENTIRIQNSIYDSYIHQSGTWLFYLGFYRKEDELSPSVDYFIRFSRLFIHKLSQVLELETLRHKVVVDISDPELAWLFENCFPNTLDTTVTYTEPEGKPDTFIITGDIHAMWLRDSSAQVWPYMPLAKQDEPLRKLIAGVINRQVKCILLDPYANAFLDGDEISEWKSDITEMKPGIHERKWEIDSLCYPIRLGYGYWKTTGDTSVFDSKWNDAMELI